MQLLDDLKMLISHSKIDISKDNTILKGTWSASPAGTKQNLLRYGITDPLSPNILFPFHCNR